MIISTFQNTWDEKNNKVRFDNKPVHAQLEWDDFVKEFSTHDYTHARKDLSPAWCPAQFKPDTKKANENVELIWLAVLDLDSVGEDTVSEVISLCEKYTFLAHTSWSHAAAQVDNEFCLRIVLPLSRPVAPTEWPRFWPRLNSYLGGKSDPQCKDASRYYYAPSAPRGTEGVNTVVNNTGKILDTDKILSLPGPTSIEAENVTDLVRVTKTHLKSLANKYARRTSDHALLVANAIRMVLKRDTYAPPGERDNTLFKTIGALVREWPTLDPESVVSLFAASHSLMESEAPGAPDAALVRFKVDRAKKEYSEKRAVEEKEKLDDLVLRIREAFGGTRDLPYTQDELFSLAQDQDLTVAEFKRHWIYQKGASYYIRVLDGIKGPKTKDDLIPACNKYLSPAINVGVELYKLTDKGTVVSKSAAELMEEYGMHCDDIRLTYVRKSGYDRPTHTFHQQVCAPRDLSPLQDPEIEEWLLLFSGHDSMYEKLSDWLSLVPNLLQPLPALYITGAKNVGKNLFVESVARLWTDKQATPMQALAGDFNEALLHCPLIFADEYIPEEFRGDKGTGRLRNLITERTWSLNRKHLPRTTLDGCIRLVMAGNNDGLISTKENLTERDIDAIVDRILHIEADPIAAEYLNDLPDLGDSFRNADRLARHVLFLQESRHIKKEHRFGIKSEAGKLHRSLTVSSGARSQVCAWLCGALMQWDSIRARPKIADGLRVADGQLYASTRALIEGWDAVKGVGRIPHIRNIGQALAAISVDGKIRTENLIEWGRDSGYVSEQEIRECLQRAQR